MLDAHMRQQLSPRRLITVSSSPPPRERLNIRFYSLRCAAQEEEGSVGVTG